MAMPEAIALNGRSYRRPRAPTVIVCADGCDPAYLDHGLKSGSLPAVASFREAGFAGEAEAAMPSFTNPNNLSIVTGAPPAVHGISGNYFLDRESGAEIMMTDERLLRSETILGLFSQRGVKTAAITAKDKLRRLLGRGLEGPSFSSEHADAAAEALVGRPRPDMYSADLSLFVLDWGLRFAEEGAADLLYLSLSDYVQHLHGPGEPAADAFHHALDARLGAFAALGAVVGLVADHGMNDKARPDGSPNIVFLEDELNRRFGEAAVRVICPITDPFVRHHGALGSFVRVYLRTCRDLAALMAVSAALPGVALVLERAEAARRFELPFDREADFVVLGDAHTVLGSRREAHDLAGLAGHRLRSHGGLGEARVPFILSHPLSPEYRERAARGGLRNFDIFDFALNGLAG
ncbi:MAG TPA: phosphonoacetate hydrolase [Stellaceae bacterium]|nr:phosphonoacetate hydrolase [Stellaceae bacterium]